MKVTGFTHKSKAKEYQKQHGGRILFAEWSSKRGCITETGKEYIKIIKNIGIPMDRWMYEASEYRYIVVEDDK